MSEWFAADQDDIDLGAAMANASTASGGWNVGSVLGTLQGGVNTASQLVRDLYRTRASITNAQTDMRIQEQRGNSQLAIATLQANQLTAAARNPISIGGFNLNAYMPLLVIAGGALLWKRLSK